MQSVKALQPCFSTNLPTFGGLVGGRSEMVSTRLYKKLMWQSVVQVVDNVLCLEWIHDMLYLDMEHPVQTP